MFSSKENFKENFLKRLEMMSGKRFDKSTARDQYNTLGNMVREYISSNWIETNEFSRSNDQKKVYYLSIEFLLGRLLCNNLLNLGIHEVVEEGLTELGIELSELEEHEADAGLGNGGLGRLAACFLDSLASLDLPGHGCGIRYRHGLFDQKIVDGYQVELPEQWLRYGNVWEVRKSDLAVDVKFFGKIESYEEDGKWIYNHVGAEVVTAVPFDVPVIGYETNTVNTLRLWSAEPSKAYPIGKNILQYKRETEAISDFLYPDDTNDEGKTLRLKQQYFLVAASLRSIIQEYKQKQDTMYHFHEHIAIHINDTHPVLAIPELMRILLDEEKMTWEDAWHITSNTVAYTNHTTLSEALEKWSISLFKPLLPRIYMIINEINERFCKELWEQYPGDWNRIEQMAIIAHDLVKMAHLAIAGSYSVNGVAKIHSEILKHREMKSFYDFYPEKFNNKTNGITHRRWLIKSNPELTNLLTNTIGTDWVKDPTKLSELTTYAKDGAFQEQLEKVKLARKEVLAKYIYDSTEIVIDTNSIFDVHVKRLHAYKRQLLNVLHIMYLYNRLKEDSSFSMHPRTFIFGAKASPGYHYAKRVIKLINSVADKVNNDPKTRDILKVIFIENYRVSIAENIFPATDVSEQISTASKEASGTGNMKFMMNGAITVGTLDGANVEIMEEVGKDNIFIFGLTADEVMNYYQNGGYHSHEYYYYDKRIRQVVTQLTDDFFPDVYDHFVPIHESLLAQNDQYFVLRDFASYLQAQEQVNATYQQRAKWLEMSAMNIAKSGFFSSDRTIMEYANGIWKIVPNKKEVWVK